MSRSPKWYMPAAVIALLWNLLGCAAYLADVTITPEQIATMSEAKQALYAARAPWAVAATATAVWGGAAGCLGLILRRRWALPLLVASLLGVIIQDYGLFVVMDGASLGGPVAVVMQGIVLVVAIALVLFARTAGKQGWLR